MRELEGLHASAAEELEGLYEARLAVEAEKLRQMSATKDDLELHFKVCCVAHNQATAGVCTMLTECQLPAMPFNCSSNLCMTAAVWWSQEEMKRHQDAAEEQLAQVHNMYRWVASSAQLCSYTSTCTTQTSTATTPLPAQAGVKHQSVAVMASVLLQICVLLLLFLC